MLVFFETHSYLTQIFGFSAIAISIFMYHFKKHGTIMFFMILCSVLWCLYYASMGLFTPMAMNAINILRCWIYSSDKKWVRSKLVPSAFIAISLVITVITWQGIWDFLPFFGSIFTIIGCWQKDAQVLRIMTIPVCLNWLTYNLINHSWAGLSNDSFTLVSLIIALIRYRSVQKETKNHS